MALWANTERERARERESEWEGQRDASLWTSGKGGKQGCRLKCYSDHDHRSRKAFSAVHLFLPCNADRPESPPPGFSQIYFHMLWMNLHYQQNISWLTKLPFYFSGNQVQRPLWVSHQSLQLYLRKQVSCRNIPFLTAFTDFFYEYIHWCSSTAAYVSCLMLMV